MCCNPATIKFRGHIFLCVPDIKQHRTAANCSFASTKPNHMSLGLRPTHVRTLRGVVYSTARRAGSRAAATLCTLPGRPRKASTCCWMLNALATCRGGQTQSVTPSVQATCVGGRDCQERAISTSDVRCMLSKHFRKVCTWCCIYSCLNTCEPKVWIKNDTCVHRIACMTFGNPLTC